MDSSSVKTSGAAAPGRPARLLPVAVGLGVLITAFIIAFFPTVQWMAVVEWAASGGVMSHGFLIVAISAVLFFRAVPEVAAVEFRPVWVLYFILLGMSVTWLLGYVATVIAVQTVVLPAILLTALVAALGFKAARPLVFPVLFLYFAVPVWTHVNFVFQEITVFVVGLMIRAADVPALLYGNFVQLSSGTFEIAGGCSGLSFVVAGLALAVLYGHLYYSSVKQKVGLTLILLLVAMAGNWIRVFSIIYLGYQSEMKSPWVDDHLTLGWVLFGLLLIPVFYIARRMEDDEAGAAETDLQGVDAALPVQRNHWIPLSVAIAAMLAGPVWAFTIASSDAEGDSLQLELPLASQPWQGPMRSDSDWSPKFAGPTIEELVEYRKGDETVLAYVNLYISQTQDQELIYYSNSVFGSWNEIRLKDGLVATVETEAGLKFRQLAARNYAGNWLIWYRYQVGDRFETSGTRTKIVQALQSLRGRPEAGIIAFAAPCSETCDQAASTLVDFVDQVGYSVRLDFTRDKK